MDDVYRDRQDPALTVWFDAGHRAGEPTERIAVWTTTPWTLPSNLALAVGPDIDVRGAGAGRREGLRRARPGWATTPRSSRAGPRSARCTGAELVGRRYTPLFDFLVEQAGPNAFQVLGGRLRHHRGRHRRRAPARRRSARTTRTLCNAAGHPDRGHRGRPHQVHRARAAVRGPAGLRGEQAGDPRPQGARRGGAARHLHPLVPALLALRHPAGLQGGVVVVRRGDPVPGPDGRAEPADHLGARRTSRTARSASGWPTPATGRSAATGSGARRSRCGSPTTRTTRGSTSTARWPSWSATSASRSPTCTGRWSTS